MKTLRRMFLLCGLAGASAITMASGYTDTAQAASTAAELNTEANQALQLLYRTNPVAEQISHNAIAVLVFPNIIKAGLVFGGSYGEGVLMEGTQVVNYYNSVSGSWGLQIGAQSFGYAVFLMTDAAMSYIGESDGWEIGVGPTVVILDEGLAANFSTSTIKDDAYAVIFDQQGLMIGVSLEGTKISRVHR